MINNLIIKNYRMSLKQKYNAVCFDIDGTLTTTGTKEIDIRALSMIEDLLIRKIPVVFITGRGETGVKDLKKNIYDFLMHNKKLSESDLKRIYVLANDGARLFYSDEINSKKFLNEKVYISTKEEFKKLKNVNNLILKLKDDLNISKYFKIDYSYDSQTSSILNIRLIFNTDDEKYIGLIYENLNEITKIKGYECINLTRGIYSGKNVIQIGTANKGHAIEETERIIGVPRNSMIRIGDCGDEMGNDFSMLDCCQGYSVDKVSGRIDACFPIFDEKDNILKGIDATLQIIKKANILPTVCLEKADKFKYLKKYSCVEKNIIHGRNSILSKYNDIINKNFDDINGIDSVFDKYSGSVIIPMYEWHLLNDSPLKRLFEKSEGDSLYYSMRDNNNYLLRGPKTYYYFLANRHSINGEDLTTKIDVINWYKNYLKFLIESIEAINITKNFHNQADRRLLLGVLDNCRNVLLVLINHKLLLHHYDDNVLLDLENKKNLDFYEIYQTLVNVEKAMKNLCFESQYNVNNYNMIDIVQSTYNILNFNFKDTIFMNEDGDYSKEYRTYREIDNFAENYVGVSLYNEKNNSTNKTLNLCGLSYGGIELPIIAKSINSNIKKVFLLRFNKKVSGYTNKQLIDLRNFNINEFGGLIGAESIKNQSVDIFDDNVLTGKTLQLAIYALYDYKIKTNNICIVRYPGVNRVDQMFMKYHGAVDYRLFFDYINGLCFSSPYSWRDNNVNIYKDSLGVFDINRRKIIECILKNHSYKEESEVGEYKRRFIK